MPISSYILITFSNQWDCYVAVQADDDDNGGSGGSDGGGGGSDGGGGGGVGDNGGHDKIAAII